MTGAVFVETLRRSWRGALFWGIGLGLLAISNVIIIPDVDALEQMAELMNTLPPVLLQMFGVTDIEFLATPEGYLSLQFFGITLLIIAVYAASNGMNVFANDEDRGVIDIVLAAPLPRWRLIVEKFAAYALLSALMLALLFVLMAFGVSVTPALQVDTLRLIEGVFNLLPGTLFITAATIFITSLIRRRGLAVAIIAVFIIASYFVDTLGAAATGSIMEPLRALSFYRYYAGATVMQFGLSWDNVAVLVGASLVLVAGSVWFFERRDVGR